MGLACHVGVLHAPPFFPLTAQWPDPLPSGAAGVAYSYQLTAVRGVPPYSFALASGSALPSGLTLSSSGLISGTPTTAVSMQAVSFTVTDNS